MYMWNTNQGHVWELWMNTEIRLERELFLVPIPSYLDHSKVAEFQLFTEYICGIPTKVMFGNCGYLESQ